MSIKLREIRIRKYLTAQLIFYGHQITFFSSLRKEMSALYMSELCIAMEVPTRGDTCVSFWDVNATPRLGPA